MTGAVPVLIAVAPNGARHSKSDHAGLPLGPRELADTAVACAEAGAAMIHVHVRDEYGNHSLEPARYRPAINEIRQAVGDQLLIQVTSEAAGVYRPDDQMRLIGELAPDNVSVAIRELFAAESKTEQVAAFLEQLAGYGSSIQYILYTPDDVRRYRVLLAAGAIPASPHWVLFVLGRYVDRDVVPLKFDDYIACLDGTVPWMACAFGSSAFSLLGDVANKGGHIRIGFENGWLLPDDSIAPDNATLVRTLADRIRESGRAIATIADTRALLQPD